MKTRKLVVINLFREGPVYEENIEFSGIQFAVTEHKIGWDFETARDLIRKYEGYVDGIALSGVQKRAAAGRVRLMNSAYLSLMKTAVKTPVYLADDVRDFFAEWTLKRILKEQPQIFQGKKVFFHCGVISPSLNAIAQAGAHVSGGDMLLMGGVPVQLHGLSQFERFLRILKPAYSAAFKKIDPETMIGLKKVRARFARWNSESDIVVSFLNLIDRLESLESLKGKILIVDALTPETREALERIGVAQIIEYIPSRPGLESLASRHFSVLTALIDQQRIAEDSPLSFDDYILKWLQDSDVHPTRLQSNRGIVRKCAFIIHPLGQWDLWKTPGMGMLERAPSKLRGLIEYGAARLPSFYYGRLRGVVSKTTGQEAECDIYAFPATPRQMLAMDEEAVYRRMVECATMARNRGACMIGLGAYTKVIGDAGVTVARQSPIPVTNGNSYSASTTLWAAREMVDKLGIISNERVGERRKAKAMVIGATGSIGRVSSLLVSLVVQELVLVATRPDKLLELRDEIQALSPSIRVKVVTNPNADLADTDLVVTATSNQSGAILDIMQVKPGAVICDCSRPLDISPEDAARRPDVLVIESGEVLLPGTLDLNIDIGLPKPSVYACLAETVLLTLEGRYENFSLSKQLSMEKVREIYRIGVKHGAQLSAIQGPNGVITEEQVENCRKLALERLKTWKKINEG